MASLLLKQRLLEAEEAEHALVTGNLERVVVTNNGVRVEYTRTNLYSLQAKIEQLKIQIKQGDKPRFRATRIYF